MTVYVYGASQSSQVIYTTNCTMYNDWISTENASLKAIALTQTMFCVTIIEELIKKYYLACRCLTLLQLYSVLWVKVVKKRMKMMFLVLYTIHY